MLALLGLLLLLFSGLLLFSLSQVTSERIATSASRTVPTRHPSNVKTLPPTATATSDSNQDDTPTPPIWAPKNTTLPPLELPANHYIIYEQQNNIYTISSNGGQPQMIATQDYSYSQAVRPILTPSGQILYSGNGLWLTDIFGNTPTQIAPLAPDEVITSMALSTDGKMIAWSTEPVDGKGVIDIHAGPIDSPRIVYEQSALTCPCFRIFSFMNGAGSKGDTILLLTDDQGSHEAVQFGLWALDLTKIPTTMIIAEPTSSGTASTPSSIAYAVPVPVMDEASQQGPLAFIPYGNTLLYSSNEGWVPIPNDNSVPQDIGSLTYPNSLDITTLSGSPLQMGTSQVILPQQQNLKSTADYHWVTTPVFSPDGHTLVYVEFTSDAQDPFDRHSAIFTVQLTGSGNQFHASKPQLLATSTAKLLELGMWFDNHILTFYADGSLYALDINSGAETTIVQTGAYARVVAVVGSPGS